MERFSRYQVINALYARKLVILFNHPDAEVAVKVAKACFVGGCRIFEFTNRCDHSFEVFSALERQCAKECPELILGAGSIVDGPTAAHYINAGARFIVSPGTNPEVAQLCNRRKIPYIPGCGTPTEIANAESHGVEFVKIFPGATLGPGFVKSIKAPCPQTSMMISGGVQATRESLSEWFSAGADCVGMGGVFSRDLVEAGDWDGIAATVRRTVEIIERLD
jgi:2-dehydro-3-deoxyphosphogluconate aldolase/(4S)-4-hydroxy-2-oxoglutarate aldolase